MAVVIFIKLLIIAFSVKKLLNRYELKPDIQKTSLVSTLKPLRNFLLTFSYYFSICGLGLSLLVIRGQRLGYFNHKWIVILGILCYITISFFLFFFPFHPVNRLTLIWKNRYRESMQLYTAPVLGKIVFAISFPIFVLLIHII
jgi:hypothetical protein